MEPSRSSGAGSGNSGNYTPEITETLRFEEEIQSLMGVNLIPPGFDCSPPVIAGSSSFTALLGLQPNQAVDLLHDLDPKSLDLPFVCSSTFPSNADLIDRAARFSIFATGENSPEDSSAIPSNSDGDPYPKSEPPDSDSKPRRSGKRKEADRSSKAKSGTKKGKCFPGGDDDGDSVANLDADKLPYVHVRARRGQATDSHSLAERARREKINARMKLLQELVPGCSKISGTALVLDEIINHVQSLQRQVEILSMRLAAVNPRIDFTGLDNLFTAECGRIAAATGPVQGWIDGESNGVMPPNHHHHHHHHHYEHQQQQPIWTVDHEQQQETAVLHRRVFISGSSSGSPPGTSLFGYDSASSALPLSSQLKSEM